MGIKGLMKFLQDASPKAIREVDGPQAFTGRLLAIDASMCLYQFMIMIRENHSGSYQNLTNEAGEVTSHIIGMLSRTIRLMENGIKPVYVFDGKPPELKLAELEGRRAKATEAKANLAKALESGDQEQILKASKGTVRVSKEQNEQTKQLLRLMGVPVVEAPSEAEATCAALCRDGKVYASATEDADCLTFGTSVLIRNLMAAESQKKPVFEVQLSRVLEQLNITMDQFIDFCILSGCDYCDTLKGVGPSTAIKMIMQHGSIEKVLEQPEMAEKVPANFRYQAARAFFQECEAVDTANIDFKFTEPDFEGLTKFLVEGQSFDPKRVERFIDRLKAAKNKTKQRPLDSFFGMAKVKINDSDKFDPTKRRGGAKAKAGADNKRKSGGSGGPAAKRGRPSR
jgi:flap endonuclease-1